MGIKVMLEINLTLELQPLHLQGIASLQYPKEHPWTQASSMLTLHSVGVREVLSLLGDFTLAIPGLSLCQFYVFEWF